MYSNADIDSLSVGQLRKLLKGGAVRVRCGSGMKVSLSAPQHKKLMSANKKGKMMTLTMDPYQAEMHGKGLFGDLVNFFRAQAAPVAAPIEQFATRDLPSALIHRGLPIAGKTLGGMAGSYYGGPVGGMAGAELGSMTGRELAEETRRRTGYGLKKMKGGQAIEHQQFSLAEAADAGRRLFGGKMKGGQAIEHQKFSLAEAADAGRRLFGGKMKGGQAIEHQQFSLAEAADAGKRLFGGKVMKGKGPVMDLLKSVAKSVGKRAARKAGSYAVHKVLPKASARLGEMAGEYLGVEGGKDVGSVVGQMLEDEIAARTGLGMKMKRGRPKKMTGKALMVAGVR